MNSFYLLGGGVVVEPCLRILSIKKYIEFFLDVIYENEKKVMVRRVLRFRVQGPDRGLD